MKLISDEDTKGYDFQIVFPSFDDEEKELSIDMTGDQISYTYNDNCIGRIESSTTLEKSHHLDVHSCFAINDTSFFTQKAINLNTFHANKEASVFVSIIGQSTRGTYLALPTDVLGLEYYAVTYCKESYQCGCALSAVYHNTAVTIELPDHKHSINVTWDKKVFKNNEVMEIKLNSHLDAFMFTSTSDLTGTYIKANGPISVVCGGRTKTALFIEQMYPIQKADMHYSVIKSTNIAYRTISTRANTIVTATGRLTSRKTLRKAGDFEDMYINDITSIKSSRPVFIIVIYEHGNVGDMFNFVPDSALEDKYLFTFPEKIENKSMVLVGSSSRQEIEIVSDGNSQRTTIGVTKNIVDLAQNSLLISLKSSTPFAAYFFGKTHSKEINSLFITSAGRKMNDLSQVSNLSFNTLFF